eukprot:422237-Prymnesium_polylepis.2
MIAAQDPLTAAALAHRVNLFVGLAPVTYLTHSKSLLLSALSESGVAGARRIPTLLASADRAARPRPPDPTHAPPRPVRSRRRCALPVLVPLWLGCAAHPRHAPVQAHVRARVQGDGRHHLRSLDGAPATRTPARCGAPARARAPCTHVHAVHTRHRPVGTHAPPVGTRAFHAPAHTPRCCHPVRKDGRSLDDRTHDGALPGGHLCQGPQPLRPVDR